MVLTADIMTDNRTCMTPTSQYR